MTKINMVAGSTRPYVYCFWLLPLAQSQKMPSMYPLSPESKEQLADVLSLSLKWQQWQCSKMFQGSVNYLELNLLHNCF